MLAGKCRLLPPDTLISVYHTVGILRRLQMHHDQRSLRVDFNTSAQQQLSDDPTVEPNYSKYRMLHILLSKINKLAMLRALESGRYLSMAFCSYRCVRNSALTGHKHSWAIKAHQNSYSARETKHVNRKKCQTDR